MKCKLRRLVIVGNVSFNTDGVLYNLKLKI